MKKMNWVSCFVALLALVAWAAPVRALHIVATDVVADCGECEGDEGDDELVADCGECEGDEGDDELVADCGECEGDEGDDELLADHHEGEDHDHDDEGDDEDVRLIA